MGTKVKGLGGGVKLAGVIGKLGIHRCLSDLSNRIFNAIICAPGYRTARCGVTMKGQDDAVWILAGDLPMMQVLVVFMGKG